MKGWIANTDERWFTFLQQGDPWLEVNFWRPRDTRAFRGEEGDPFLFRMRAPHKAIGGFAHVAKFSWLPEWLAWDCFGTGNGAASADEFRALLGSHREGGKGAVSDLRMIGCIILLGPVFFPKELWIPQPASWGGPIQNNKSYSPQDPEWRALWAACQERAVQLLRLPTQAQEDVSHGSRWGRPTMVTPRLGQGAFRVAVLDAYGRACAATREHSLPTLEAAHIKPFALEGPHAVNNGLLLRSDLHRLFDRGYVTVTPDHRLVVGDRLKEHFDNGKSYYPLHGREVVIPRAVPAQPAPELLRWHNENRFLG